MQIKFYLPTLSLFFFIACTPSIEKEAISSSEIEVNSTPENHELLDFWADPPMHSTFDIYLWNVTNLTSVLVKI